MSAGPAMSRANGQRPRIGDPAAVQAEFVRLQLRRLAAAFPTSSLFTAVDDRDQPILAHYREELLVMVEQFGGERVVCAVNHVIRHGVVNEDGRRNLSFLPTIAELRSCVPPPDPSTQAKPLPGCTRCGGAGWMPSPSDPTRVTKCECERRAN